MQYFPLGPKKHGLEEPALGHRKLHLGLLLAEAVGEVEECNRMRLGLEVGEERWNGAEGLSP